MDCIRLLIAVLMVTACAPGRAQTSVQPGSVSEQFQRGVSGAERATLTIANAMPEDRYNFVPSHGAFKGVRSFALLARHIAVDNYLAGAALLGEKPPIEPGPHENGPDTLQSKAQIMKFLRDSFIYLHKGMSKVNDKNLMEIIDYPGGVRVTRLAVIISAVSHPWDIYGQMVEYLRLNGIDPQAVPVAE